MPDDSENPKGKVPSAVEEPAQLTPEPPVPRVEEQSAAPSPEPPIQPKAEEPVQLKLEPLVQPDAEQPAPTKPEPLIRVVVEPPPPPKFEVPVQPVVEPAPPKPEPPAQPIIEQPPQVAKILYREASRADVREHFTRIPRVTETEFRIACSDIAENLSKNWGFLGRVLIAIAVILAVFLAVVGWSIHTLAENELNKAGLAVDSRVNDEFKDDKIKAVTQQAAAGKSAELFQNNIQPNIKEFNRHLKEQTIAYDKEVAALRNEVAKLKERNELTTLADAAIDTGDLSTFQKLHKLATDPSPPEGAVGEFIRTMNVYSVFGPVRYSGATLDANTIHPGKTREDELDMPDLLMVENGPDPAGRARAAVLIGKIGKPGSYATAKAIVDAIQKENDLWVIKDLKPAFAHIIPFQDTGDPTGQDIVKWWDAHESEIAKTDTDKRSTEKP